ANCYLQAAPFGQVDQGSCFSGRNCEGLFQINMAARLETLFSNRIMAWWWSCNVDDVGGNDTQHFVYIRKTGRNSKAFPELFRHQRFLVANGHNSAIRNPLDCVYVLVRNLSATNDANF